LNIERTNMNEMSVSQKEKTSQFADRITEERVGPCRLLMLTTPVDDVVTWRGSFRSHPDFAAGEDLVQDVMVSLLDKGTAQRDRFEIAEVIEDRGAELSFSGKTFRIRCRGRALSDDVPDVLAVMAEQLRESAFEPDEFPKALRQTAGSLQRMMESTSEQASGALARRLYGESHPNYTPEPRAQLQQLQSLTPEAVQSFHEQHVGANDFTLAFAGDLDEDAITQAVRDHFGDWSAHDAPASFSTEGAGRAPDTADVPMPDKDNVDVCLARALPVRRDDEDYLPLYVGNYILGGNFSARLMASIRDDMGLTYGIGSRLAGVSTEHDGDWRVNVSLSRENLERGLSATREELRRFVEEGATKDELDEKKTTITGSFKVGLATTGGLAESLLRVAQRSFPLDYLDRFPELIRAISRDELNDALRRHLDPEQLHVARAGQLRNEQPA
jgi:predicted Zn-dependent peptidase